MVGMALAAETRAESGISRPGATSRFWASESRSSHISRTAASWRRSRIWWSPEVLPPRVNPGRSDACRQDGGELLLGVFQFAVRLEQLDQFFAQFGEDLHVQGGVAQPRLGEGPGGPVSGGMLLGEAESQQLFDDGGQPDARQAGKPRSQFGVEESVRPHAELKQAREVLAGGMQNPFDTLERIVDDGQVFERFGIYQPRAGAFAADLDEEGALAVAEP